jgi:uncharacterized protein (TIGR00251 family)
MLGEFIKKFDQDGEVYFRVKVRPGASLTALKQVLKDCDGEIMKIDIAAPAVKGRANQALIKFLAGEFAIGKNNVRIISGAGDRLKLVKIVK